MHVYRTPSKLKIRTIRYKQKSSKVKDDQVKQYATKNLKNDYEFVCVGLLLLGMRPTY